VAGKDGARGESRAPKSAPFYYFTVKMAVERAKDNLVARIVSIVFLGKQDW
jgi:hypothetical protein